MNVSGLREWPGNRRVARFGVEPGFSRGAWTARSRAWTAHSGWRSDERRPPFAALPPETASSEPRVKRAEGPRERAVFCIASKAARSVARTSGPIAAAAAASPAAHEPRGAPAWTACSGWRSDERRPPFAALPPETASSEPRVKRAEGPRERAVFCIASKAARSVARTSGPIAAAAAVTAAAHGPHGATHGRRRVTHEPRRAPA
jgi:hypothetical protein